MGFNPLEKMKQAAYDNTVGKAKEAAENAKMNAKMFAEEKAGELGTKAKDSAIDAAKKVANGESLVKQPEMQKVADADDYLELAKKSTIAVLLCECYDKSNYKGEEDEDEHSEYECCKQCGSWFGDTESEFYSSVKSYVKKDPLVKDKELDCVKFCSEDCAREYYAKKAPDAFITLDYAQLQAFLAAGRKLNGTETKFDKFNSKMTKSYNEGVDKGNAMREAEKARKEAEKAKLHTSPLASLLKLFKK